MRIGWTKPALDDVRTIVPEGFRPALRRHLERLPFVGQGRRCVSDRCNDAYFLSFRHWLVMYLALDEGSIGVICVEYNYGQEP